MKINGLPLPDALFEAIKTGRWVVPGNERLQASFPLEKVVQPLFYPLDMIERENASWHNETDKVWMGKKDAVLSPGDIVPALSLLIADLGPDRCIALDYRNSKQRPRVVYFTSGTQSRWVEAAPDIETLLHALMS